MKEKIKKISKYIVNGLNMINALILVLSPIWNWNLDNISKTIIGITGVISVYLVSGKLFDTETIETDDLVSQNHAMPEYPDDEISDDDFKEVE